MKSILWACSKVGGSRKLTHASLFFYFFFFFFPTTSTFSRARLTFARTSLRIRARSILAWETREIKRTAHYIPRLLRKFGRISNTFPNYESCTKQRYPLDQIIPSTLSQVRFFLHSLLARQFRCSFVHTCMLCSLALKKRTWASRKVTPGAKRGKKGKFEFSDAGKKRRMWVSEGFIWNGNQAKKGGESLKGGKKFSKSAFTPPAAFG